MKLRLFPVLLLVSISLSLGAEEIDLSVVHRIKDEAFRGSKVMDHLFFLTDVNGPRLTGSPGQRAASAWAVRQLDEWGISGARTEVWGKFGRGWSLERFSLSLKEPVYAQMGGIPKAWSSGTQGVVTGEVVLAPLFTQEETARAENRNPRKLAERIKRYSEEYRGKLKGKFVLITAPRELDLPATAESERYDEKALAKIAEAPEPVAAAPIEWPIVDLPDDPNKARKILQSMPNEITADLGVRRRHITDRLNEFLRDEGAAAVLMGDRRGTGGIVFAESGGSWETGAPIPPPVVSLPPESYDRLCRLAQKKIPATVELDVQATFHDEVDGTNVVGEIPGGDRKDEIVMLGAHIDSWHSGTGATDNAAGSAVALEAIRILKALDLPMRRTVRLALWTGEEQGLLGSRGYVRSHLADPVTMKLLPEHAKLSGYFNVDNGTGKIRGVYLQGNDMMRPIFEQWLKPFKDLGAATITIDDTGGTDHLPFDAVGLPGFQFIQDPLDYSSRTHHSDLDVYDHLRAADLMQASAILASVVYDAATRSEMLPRKPLPSPLPPKRQDAVEP